MGSTTVPVEVQTFGSAPDELLDLLAARIPATVPVLRRLQFARFKSISTPSSRVVVASDAGFKPDANLAVAYVDLLGGPDTQMWLYSSLEGDSSYDAAVHERILVALVDALVRMRKQVDHPLRYGDSILLGTLHSETRKLLIKHGRVEPRPSGDYDKWLFKVANLPPVSTDLPAGMHWSKATLDDCRLVASRTDIPRPPELLYKFANVMIKLDDGRPIVWAFIGPEGSLVSLHCEEDFRKRGLAKLVSIKLLRDNAGNIPGDEWTSADVAPDNVGSRAMCKSLGGTPHWSVSWVLLSLEEK